MFVQTEITPNPNSLKFIPGKVVSSEGSFEVTKNDKVNNELIRNILSINGVEGIFLSKDFISVNKYDEASWDEIKHIIISLINDFERESHQAIGVPRISKRSVVTKANLRVSLVASHISASNHSFKGKSHSKS